MVIIPIAGKACSGKDSFAKMLQIKLELLGKKCLIISNADYLKFILKQYYGWNGLKDEKGRSLLQEYGTEKIRAKNPTFWVDTIIRFIEVVEDDFDFVLIADVRFPDEITKWDETLFDVMSVYITRINFKNNLTEKQKSHLSETALNDFVFDYYIEAENLIELEEKTEDFLYELKSELYKRR